MATTKNGKDEPVDIRLEVVVIGVSDVDRAKTFYGKLGWRLDADFVTGDDFRVIQLTPHNSPASIIFGKGVPSPEPGSVQSLTLAVDDIEAARKDLIGRGPAASRSPPRVKGRNICRSITRSRRMRYGRITA